MSNEIRFDTKVEFPMDHPYMIDTDLQYLREKIRTFRAINTEAIGYTRSQYFESAVTMIDLAEYILRSKLNYILTSCDIHIDPGIVTTVKLAGHVPVFILGVECNEKVNVDIVFTYTSKDVPGCPQGYYKIEMIVWNSVRETIGDTLMTDIMPVVPVENQMDKCFRVSSTGALRYCENFPMPSIFVKMVCDTWGAIMDEITRDE